MKTIIILTISIFLLNSCKEEEEVIDYKPINGDLSFTIDGQRYSSSLNWNIDLFHNAYKLTIQDTLGFEFGKIFLYKNESGVCGIVIPDEYNLPEYNPLYLSNDNDSCFVVYPDWGEDELKPERDSLAIL